MAMEIPAESFPGANLILEHSALLAAGFACICTAILLKMLQPATKVDVPGMFASKLVITSALQNGEKDTAALARFLHPSEVAIS
jgi:hypothetical protein